MFDKETTRAGPDLPTRPDGGERTRERILDAADRLFAERGYRATSMRVLTRAAEVNLAAVHYHFGSKADLLRAALERHVAPINAERLRRLDALERGHPGGVPVDDVLAALFRPAFEFGHGSPKQAETARRLVALIHGETPDVVQPLSSELFAEIQRRFVHALARASPALSRRDVERRFALAVGSMLMLASGRIPAGPDPRDDARSIEDLIVFAAAGFQAPSLPPTEENPP